MDKFLAKKQKAQEAPAASEKPKEKKKEVPEKKKEEIPVDNTPKGEKKSIFIFLY